MTRLFLGFAALALLAACGVQGDLERPDPLWNRAHAIQVECRRERAHHEPLDHRCNPPAPAATAPTATTAPVTPPASPTAPDTTNTTTSTTTTTP